MSKKSLKRVLCAVLAFAMSASLLTACGKKKTGVAEADKEGNVTLTVTDWENEATNKAMRKAFDEFTAANPKIKVKIMPAPLGDYGLKLGQMLSSGQAPDVFQLGHDMGVTFFQKGLTYDWTEKVEAEEGMEEKYAPNTFTKWHLSNGKYFGLPGLLNVYGVFYNKDKLAAAGLDEPTKDWTWEDMFDYAEKLKGGKDEYGLYNIGFDLFQTNMMSVSEGGVNISEEILEPTKVVYDDTLKAMVKRVADARKSGAIPISTYEAQNIQDIFRQGQIPMLWYGQWQLADFVNNGADCNWEYVSNPVGSKDAVTMYDCTGWASPKNIKAVDEIWQLIKFCSTDMYKVVLADQPVAASAYNDSAEAFYKAVTDGGHPKSAQAVKDMLNMGTKTMIRFYPEWKDDAKKVTDVVWNPVCDGEKPVDDLDKMFEDLNNVIAKGTK